MDYTTIYKIDDWDDLCSTSDQPAFTQSEKEKNLREEYPELQKLWEEYQVMLRLLDSPSDVNT